jgi:uncharacterized CHY-type Zn-finger protein
MQETDSVYLKQIPAIAGENIDKSVFFCKTCHRHLTVFEYRTNRCLQCEGI